MKFELCIITLPEFFEGETALVNALFEHGMQRLHLRKPQATEQQMAEWIEQIAHPFRHHIVVHDHHQLAIKYHLGGVHLNSRNPSFTLSPLRELERAESFTISRSCHSIAEVVKYKDECDYVFLSPIFDSISKQGYGAAFSREELSAARSQGILASNVYALGGISHNNITEVAQLGFSGAAVLGALWQCQSISEAALCEKYDQLKQFL